MFFSWATFSISRRTRAPTECEMTAQYFVFWVKSGSRSATLWTIYGLKPEGSMKRVSLSLPKPHDGCVGVPLYFLRNRESIPRTWRQEDFTRRKRSDWMRLKRLVFFLMMSLCGAGATEDILEKG